MFSLKKKNEKPLDDYLKDWPIQFYQLSDVPLRDKCIRRYLDIHPDSTIDQRRYDIFLQRFGVKEQKVDGYFYNWNLLKAESESSSFLNKKHRQNNLRKYFIGLGVLSTTMDDLQKELLEAIDTYFKEEQDESNTEK